MSTVSKQPVAPKTVAPKSNITSDSVGGSAGYARPQSGGNATGDNTPAPAGPTPGYSISMGGAPVSTGGTQAGPDMGSGATQVGPTGDRPSGGKQDATGGGTVGDSGPQGGQ